LFLRRQRAKTRTKIFLSLNSSYYHLTHTDALFLLKNAQGRDLENGESAARGSTNKRNLNDSLIGTQYFRQVGDRIIDTDTIDSNFGYSVSMSDDGLTVAISGMCTDNSTNKHFFRVKIFEEINDAWSPKGTKIDNNRTTEFFADSRAHVNLSGDGTKLSVATVYIKDRGGTTAESNAEGSVVVYEYGTNDDWGLTSTEYAGDAGVGPTANFIYNGLTASLDTNGSMIAIGMRYFDGADGGPSIENKGAVIVCNVGDSSSCKTVATGSAANDYVGSSVMISGNSPSCVVFGSVGSDTANGTDSGSASVYCDENSNGTWTRRGVSLTGEGSRDEFGFSVAISSDSNYIAVGARRNDRNVTNTNDNGGHVRVYKFDSNTLGYVQIGNDIDGERGGKDQVSYYEGDFSGYSLALSDKTDDNLLRVAVGAPNNEGGDYYNGHVRLYECYPEATSPVWVQVLHDIDGQTNRESAGRSVAISQDGTRIIFGSPDFDYNGGGYYAAGSAVVYEQTEYSANPSSSPSQSPTSTSAPSSSPSLSEKATSSPEQEMIFAGVEELSASAIDHWKSVTETTILNILVNTTSGTRVEINILTMNGVAYDGRRHLLQVLKPGMERERRAQSSVRIGYVIIISSRVEEEEKTPYDDSLQSAVSDALESEEYDDALIEGDSSGESAFANVTIQIGELIGAFQIRTNFEGFDSSGNTTWCLRAPSIALGSTSMLNVRRCDYSKKRQLWSTDSYDQLQLAAFPQNPTCIKTESIRIVLGTCAIVVDDGNTTADDTQSFTFEDNGGGKMIKQIKFSRERFIGVEAERKFSRVKLYRRNDFNDSLNKWFRVNGKFSTILQTWDPIL